MLSIVAMFLMLFCLAATFSIGFVHSAEWCINIILGLLRLRDPGSYEVKYDAGNQLQRHACNLR